MSAPIVITSINPYGRTALQMQCFRAWKDLGIKAYTANCEREAHALRSLGVDNQDIYVIPDEETGEALFGKPVPRIAPLLRRIGWMHYSDPIMLVNSDLYPAIRSAKAFEMLLRHGSALGLTRSDVNLMECATFDNLNPYLGGIDAFLFQPEKLQAVVRLLEKWPATERMAFGVPGWDFMLGMAISSPPIGGTLMNSGFLLHKFHEQAYGDINEFLNYIGPLQELKGDLPGDVTGAASEIASVIAESCTRHAVFSEMVTATYFQRPEAERLPSPAALKICYNLRNLAPWVRWNYNFYHMSILAEDLMSTKRIDLENVFHFFYKYSSVEHRFSETLLAILFCMDCRPDIVQGVTRQFPRGNLHGKAVEQIRHNTKGKPEHTRFFSARLFASELFNYQLMSSHLFNYLALACENTYERNILLEIRNKLRSQENAA